MTMPHFLTDLLYPDICLVCGDSLSDQENHLCLFCQPELPETRFWTYTENPMYQAIRGRVNIELASAYLYYTSDNASKHLIHDFKYHGVKGVGHHLSTLFAKRLLDAQCFSEYNLIVPIPLHRRKMLKRGFNQSAIIAKGLSEVLGINTASNILIRRRYKQSQTQKSRFGRSRNMEGIYDVIHPELIQDKRILLVDDVFTTGATMEACVNVLHTASPKAISIATLAYTE